MERILPCTIEANGQGSNCEASLAMEAADFPRDEDRSALVRDGGSPDLDDASDRDDRESTGDETALRPGPLTPDPEGPTIEARSAFRHREPSRSSLIVVLLAWLLGAGMTPAVATSNEPNPPHPLHAGSEAAEIARRHGRTASQPDRAAPAHRSNPAQSDHPIDRAGRVAAPRA